MNTRSKLILSAYLLCAINMSLIGQTYQLEYDINAGEDSALSQFSIQLQIGERLFFTAQTAEIGNEIFVLSEDNMVAVSDINVGVGSSNPSSLVEYDGRLFFVANDGSQTGLYMLDAADEVVSLSGDIGSIQSEILVVDNVGVYCFAGDKVYLYNGVTLSEIEGLDFEYERFDNYSSSNVGRYKDGIALLSAGSGAIDLVHVTGSSFVILSTIPFNTTFSDYHSLAEFDGGIAFVLYKVSEGDSGLYRYNESNNSSTRTTESFCRRSAQINSEAAIYLTADGIVLFSGDFPQGAFMNSTFDPISLSSGANWMSVALGDKIIVNSQKTGFFDEAVQVINSNSITYGETFETGDAYFSNGIKAGDFRAIFCDGSSNGFSPSIIVYDSFSDSFDRYYTFTESSTESDFVKPMVVFDDRLFFNSPLDPSVGREIYSIELDFSLSANDPEFSEDWKLKVLGNSSFMVESESISNIKVQIFDTAGRRIQSFDTNFNSTIEYQLPNGISLINVTEGDVSYTFKAISF